MKAALFVGLAAMAGLLVLMLRGMVAEAVAGRLPGLFALVDRVVVLGLVVVWTASAVGWGLGLLRLMRLRPDSAVKQIVYGAGLGLGFYGLLTLGLGGAGWVRQGWIQWIVVLAGLVGTVLFGHRLPRVLAREFLDDVVPVLRHPTSIVVLVGGALALGCVLVSLFQPVFAYDVTEYHLGGPAGYYRSGRIGFVEYNVYTNFPFQVEMLYLQAMSLRGDVFLGVWMARGINLALYGLTVLAMWSMIRRYVGRTYALFGAATAASLPWIVQLTAVCYNELGLLFYCVLTLFAVCDWLRDGRKRSILLAGLFGGLAMGCKYPAGFFLVGVVASLVLAGMVGRMRVGLKRTALALALFAAGWAIAFGPWMVKNVVLTGNPLYPQFYGLLGGRAWSTGQAAKWQRAHGVRPLDEGRLPQGVNPQSVRALYGPEAFRVYVVGLLTAGRVPPYELPFSPMPLLALGPLAVFAAWRSRRVRMYVIVGAVGLAAWYLLTHRIGRFMVPYVPAAILLGCEGMKVLEVGLKRGWIGRAIAAVGVCLCAGWLVMVVSLGGGVSVGLLESSATVLSPVETEDGQSGPGAAAQRHMESLAFKHLYAVRQIVGDDRMLALGEAEALYLPAGALYSTVFDVQRMDEALDSGDPAGWLVEQGIDYVYCNWMMIGLWQRPGNYGFSSKVRPEVFHDMVGRGQLRRVYSSAADQPPDGPPGPGRFELYRVTGSR